MLVSQVCWYFSKCNLALRSPIAFSKYPLSCAVLTFATDVQKQADHLQEHPWTPHPIHHPQEVPDQEESEQPEPKYVILEENDDDYYGYHEGGWVDTDTEEEPMELPEDHPEVSSGSNEDPAGGDDADLGATGGDEDEDGGDDSVAPDGGDNDPYDYPEPAVAASPPPPEPHYEKQIHCLDFTEGPCNTLILI
jgi:hypothetical protein